jgi:hypothetical protein
MSQQKRAKSEQDLFKPFSLYARSAVYTTCVLPDATVELIISDPWWEMLFFGALGGDLQMPLQPVFFFIFSCVFIHLWFL